MALADLIRKRGNSKFANDNPAKAANDGEQASELLAELAALALSNPGKEKTANLERLDIDDTAQTSFKWWHQYYADDPSAEVTRSHAASCAGVPAGKPDVAVIEPSQPGPRKPPAALNRSEEKAIRQWLARVGETDLQMIKLVLEECRTDADARDYFLGQVAEVRLSAYLSDDRRLCTQCGNLTANGQCLAARRGAIIASRDYHPVRDILRRCEGYEPGPDDPDRRSGRERWGSVITK